MIVRKPRMATLLHRTHLLAFSSCRQHITSSCLGVERLQHHHRQDMNMSYSDFLVTHLPIFSGAKDPLEADDWLHTTESKFSLLHYTEYQETLYAAKQMRGLVGAWYISYTTALLADHHVSWDEFCVAFCGHH
jgi:hypothetical protein